MLDDIQRRRFLVDPARENAVPALVELEDVQLQESAGQLFIFPWRSGFAGAEPNDRVLHPHRHAGFHPDVADDAVALVEKRNHRDPLAHRRNVRVLARSCSCFRKLDSATLVLVLALAPSGEQQRQQRARNDGSSHAQSGVQA